MASGIDPVAEQTNWRLRVRRELTTIENWEEQWGFLKGAPAHDSLDDFTANSPKSAMQNVFCMSQHESVRDRTHLTRGDSLDSFVTLHLKRSNGHDMRMMPKEEFQRPFLTSHDYGWYKSVERFGPLMLRMT